MNHACEVCRAPAVTHVADLHEIAPTRAPATCPSCHGTKQVGHLPCIACGGSGLDGDNYRRWEEGAHHHYCEDHVREPKRVYLKAKGKP